MTPKNQVDSQSPTTTLLLHARLIADVGGTNARFGWQPGPGQPISDILVLQVADHLTAQIRRGA